MERRSDVRTPSDQGRLRGGRRLNPSLLTGIDEIGHRGYAEFLHDAPAMDLDRMFGDTQVVGDLLVAGSRNHAAQHLFFSRCEGVDPRAQCLGFEAIDPGSSMSQQGLAHSRQQDILVHGLRQEVERTLLHRPDRHGDVAVSGEKDDGRSSPSSASRTCNPMPSNSGIRTSSRMQPTPP